MDKEFRRIQFGVDSKKFHFGTNSDGELVIKFKIHFPNKFEFLEAKFDGDDLIQIDFKGLEGCEVNDSLMKSTKEETENIDLELKGIKSIPEIIKIKFEMVKVEKCDQTDFVPETAGGGILVGTGG